MKIGELFMSINDFRGLKCPIPVLKAFKIIKDEKVNNNFIFLTDDKSAPEDFKDFCKNTGLSLVEIKKYKNYHEIVIKRN